MFIVKVFIRKTGCPKCHQILEGLQVFKDKEVEFQIYDVDTMEGLAESSYYIAFYPLQPSSE